MNDNEIAGDPEPFVAPSRQKPHTRRPPRPAVGPATIFVILATLSGAGGNLVPNRSADVSGTFILGFAVAFWELTKKGERRCPEQARLHGLASKTCRSSTIVGFIDYRVKEILRLIEPFRWHETYPYDLAALGPRDGVLLRSAGDPGRNVQCKTVFGEWAVAKYLWSKPFAQLQHGLAEEVMKFAWPVMHSVAIGKRINRDLLFDRRTPSRKVLGKFLKAVGPVERDGGHSEDDHPIVPRGCTDPQVIIDCLDATADLKDIRRLPSAVKKIATIIARQTGVKIDTDAKGGLVVGYNLLRTGRPRLDAVVMHLWRRFFDDLFRTMLSGDVNIYLYADGSSQWRGLELFASSFQVHDGRSFGPRRLFPINSIDKSQLDAVGKLITLLWQVFLVAGPSKHSIRMFCNRVRSLTTDMGTERLLAVHHDVLDMFMQVIHRRPVTAQPDFARSMFPRAVQAPGWQHMIDTWIQRGLSSQRWFPTWLDVV